MPQIDWRDQQTSSEALAQAAMKDAGEAKQLVKSAGIVFEKYFSITRTGILSVLAAPQVASIPVPEARVGDLVFVHRSAKPTNGPAAAPLVVVGGISIESTAFVASDGVVEVYYSIPTVVVSLGSVLTIPVRLRGFRAS